MTYNTIREQDASPRRQTPMVSQTNRVKTRSTSVLGGTGESLRTPSICSSHLSTQKPGAITTPKSVKRLRHLRALGRITPGPSGEGPMTLKRKQDAPSRVHSTPLVCA